MLEKCLLQWNIFLFDKENIWTAYRMRYETKEGVESDRILLIKFTKIYVSDAW